MLDGYTRHTYMQKMFLAKQKKTRFPCIRISIV